MPKTSSVPLVLLMALQVAAAAGPALAEDSAAGLQLAPPGACAKPRGLPKAAAPTSFEVVGTPADHLSPTQVATEMLVASSPQAPPASPLGVDTPGPGTGPGLCDDPGACSASSGPVFIEPEPVPGLPPGLGGEPPRGDP